jgi:hypothetical protein
MRIQKTFYKPYVPWYQGIILSSSTYFLHFEYLGLSNFFNYFISLVCHFFFLLAQEENLTKKKKCNTLRHYELLENSSTLASELIGG